MSAVLVLTACGSGRTDDTASPSAGAIDGAETTEPAAPAASIIVGTTDKVTTIDPAGSYDNGSYNVEIQVYSFVLSFPPGNPVPTPDAAESCAFTDDPTVYECVLKEGLTFANGNPLTASDVKFTFDRQVAINDPSGPASLLANLESVEVVDELTVQFHLISGDDVTFEQVLASPVGPLVDEDTFPADGLLPDADIVAAQAFSGPYTIGTYDFNQVIEYVPNPGYVGAQGTVANDGVTMRYYTDPTNMRLDIASGDIDVATRSLTPTDIETLDGTDGVTVYTGPGGEIRYLVFNLDTQPGDTPEQKLAVRQAIASLIDRDELSEQVYKGTYTPLYSFVPDGLPGANESLAEVYGTTPNPEAAAAFLADAGVATPVVLNLQYNPDHYGSSSDQEYNSIKNQLEADGLFTVNLQATEWVTYAEERTQDAYPVYQLGWFPDFPDADNYLTPFFDVDNFLANHFEDADISALLDAERTETDPDARAEIIGQIQDVLAAEHLSTLPFLQGAQVAIGRDGVGGIEDTLDASFQFRFSVLTKG